MRLPPLFYSESHDYSKVCALVTFNQLNSLKPFGLIAPMSLRPETPSAKRKKLVGTKLSTNSHKSSIARFMCFLSSCIDYLKGAFSKKHPKEVAKAWGILSALKKLKWRKAKQKVRNQHAKKYFGYQQAKKYLGYIFKPNRDKKTQNVKPDVVDAPDNHDSLPPLSSFPACPPLTQLQDSIRLPCLDKSITHPTDPGLHAPPQFQGQVHGIPESLHRRSSSSPVLSERCVLLQSTATLTDFTPASLNQFRALSGFGPRLSYSGIRPGFISMENLLPASSLYQHKLTQHSIHSSVKQEEEDHSHILDNDRTIDSVHPVILNLC